MAEPSGLIAERGDTYCIIRRHTLANGARLSNFAKSPQSNIFTRVIPALKL